MITLPGQLILLLGRDEDKKENRLNFTKKDLLFVLFFIATPNIIYLFGVGMCDHSHLSAL